MIIERSVVFQWFRVITEFVRHRGVDNSVWISALLDGDSVSQDRLTHVSVAQWLFAALTHRNRVVQVRSKWNSSASTVKANARIMRDPSMISTVGTVTNVKPSRSVHRIACRVTGTACRRRVGGVPDVGYAAQEFQRRK